jgi:hypothetical protein
MIACLPVLSFMESIAETDISVNPPIFNNFHQILVIGRRAAPYGASPGFRGRIAA